jgi:hypothetical protein
LSEQDTKVKEYEREVSIMSSRVKSDEQSLEAVQKDIKLAKTKIKSVCGDSSFEEEYEKATEDLKGAEL